MVSRSFTQKCLRQNIFQAICTNKMLGNPTEFSNLHILMLGISWDFLEILQNKICELENVSQQNSSEFSTNIIT